MKISAMSMVAGACLALLIQVAPAGAQATRTWVSGVGDDANPCSRTAPCKTFAGAISKTAAGGEINTLDPGGFGAVTITKSITIADDGTGTAGVLVSGTNGIIVAAAATDRITIRGLTFNGLGSGINGIMFNSGAMLSLENVKITGFTNYGVLFQPSTAGRMNIEDSTIENNGSGTNGGGVLVRPVAGGSASVDLNTVRLINNVLGLRVENSVAGAGQVIAAASNTTAASNTYSGFVVSQSAGGGVSLNIDRSNSLNNGVGLNLAGAAAIMRVSNSMITGNATGVSSSTSNLMSYGNNHVDDNATPGFTMPNIPSK
jgi:hypothetical protein